MTDEQVLRKVMDVQKEFQKRLYKPFNSSEKIDAPKLLKMINESGASLLEFAFGKFGYNLGRFTKSLDMTHPDIFSVLDGVFNNEHEFAKQCTEFLFVADYAVNNDLRRIFPLLCKLLIEESLDKNIVRKIDNIDYSRLHVRLVKESALRDELRMSKKMQLIDLQAIYKKGEEIWTMQPDCFQKFLRFDSAYSQEIKKAEKKKKRYEDMGCVTLAQEIAKSIDSFKDNMQHSYYGFNRITMTNAAIILAKFSGYEYNSSSDVSSNSSGRSSDSYISVEKSHFTNYDFEPKDEQSLVFNNCIIDLSKSIERDGFYTYQPKVYPFHMLKDLASETLKKTIDCLENFPEANQKPIFDHFGVIVPTIEYKKTFVKDTDGNTKYFDKPEEASKFLDKNLIKCKCIFPIIVGEKDGKCYFICYWV